MPELTREEKYLASSEQFHRMRDTIDALQAKLDAADKMTMRWKKAVEGLTPSGSEFVNDPEYCAAFIRKRTEYPKMIIDLRAEVERLKEQEKELRKSLKEARSEVSRRSGELIDLHREIKSLRAERDAAYGDAIEAACRTVKSFEIDGGDEIELAIRATSSRLERAK